MKRLLTMVLAIAAVGCTKQEPVLLEPEQGKIRVFTGIDSPVSKAVVTQQIGLLGAQFVKKDSSAQPKTFSNITPLAGNISAETGEVNFVSGAPAYAMGDSTAWLVAYAPAGTLASSVVSWSIDGKTDILRTNAIWDAGKYSAPNTGASGTKLQFNHQLSQVAVVCKAEVGSDSVAVRAVWGKIKKVEFVGAPSVMEYNLKTLAISSKTPLDVALLQDYNGKAFVATVVPKNANDTVNACAMLAPIAATATESFKLKVTTEGATTATDDDKVQTILVDLSGSKAAMTAGHTHKVTLTFKANGKDIDIMATTIQAWTNGTLATNDIEQQLAPTVMAYGKSPFSVVTGLSGRTLYSYNTWLGVVAVPNTSGGNGKYVTVEAPLYTMEMPYGKLEVASTNVVGSNWAALRAACTAIVGGGWRLPRASELKWIYGNKVALEGVSGFTEFGVSKYFSATEFDATNVWAISFATGTLSKELKTATSFSARCVREVK